MKDYYEILQVSRNAEPEVIVAAYRRLARMYHPDAYAGADASVRMRELNEAYEVLSDSAGREAYDQARHHAGSDAPSPPHQKRQERRKTERTPSRKPAPRRPLIVYGLLAVVVLGIGIAGGVWIAERESDEGDNTSSRDFSNVEFTSESLTAEDLRNGTYPSELAESGAVTLVDGKLEQPREDPFFRVLTVWLSDEIGLGDLDGDGDADAAVVIATNSGGSGTFHELLAVTRDGRTNTTVASKLLGDRVVIESLSIVDGIIELDMIIQGPDDALCCPSVRVTKFYSLFQGRLYGG